MPAGNKYAAALNTSNGLHPTTAVYDSVIDEWTHLVRNYVYTGALWVPQKSDAAGDLLAKLIAGSEIIGKMGIDQTIPGVTNKVAAEVTGSIPGGTNIMGIVGIDQTTPGISNGFAITGKKTGNVVSASFTRPNDTTAYLDKEVIGTNPAANLVFNNVLAGTGASFAIVGGLMVLKTGTIPAGITSLKLHLFDAAPTPIADNAAFNILAADADKYLGFVPFSVVKDFGDTLSIQDDNLSILRKLAVGSTSLYGVLQTETAFTPPASLEIIIKLSILPQ